MTCIKTTQPLNNVILESCTQPQTKTCKTHSTTKQWYEKSTRSLNNDMQKPLNHWTRVLHEKIHLTTCQWHAKTDITLNNDMQKPLFNDLIKKRANVKATL